VEQRAIGARNGKRKVLPLTLRIDHDLPSILMVFEGVRAMIHAA